MILRDGERDPSSSRYQDWLAHRYGSIETLLSFWPWLWVPSRYASLIPVVFAFSYAAFLVGILMQAMFCR
jgi:hypothetical protein